LTTVNFRQTECTLQYVKSISLLSGFDRCNILVVDNNSGDRSAECIGRVADEHANIELIASSENRGYFGAVKWALNQYLAHHPLPDWLIVCNNDIVFHHPDLLTVLLGYDPRKEGVLAPAVISNLTGRDSNPMIAARPGRVRLLRYRFLLSSYPIARLTQKLAPAARKLRYHLRGDGLGNSDRQRIYAPHGAMIIFSRRYFEAGGTIDDGSFLFAEEFSVAETCLRLGLPLVHDPALRVRHNDSQTTGRLLTRQMYRHQKEGLRYAIRTYLDPPRSFANGNAATTDLI
jgi:GT2 family glycosyltransferase